jgi:hypothetical protein
MIRTPRRITLSWILLLYLIVTTLLFHPAASALTRREALKELGLQAGFTEKQLKSAYRSRSLVTHPDKAGGSNDKFVLVSEAYQVLSEESGGGSSSSSKFSSDGGGMNDAERMRQAEEMFFSMFDDLFEQDTVSGAIDQLFEGVKPAMWTRMLKSGLKWVVPKLAKLMESDSATIQINGVTMTGAEFKHMRETRQNRLKLQKKQQQQLKDDL